MGVLCRRLHLANTRHNWKELVHTAETEQWSYRDFLAWVLAEEVSRRNQTRVQRLKRAARFPFFKTIDEFDFTFQSSLRPQLIGSYLGPELVSEGRNLILQGRTGRGKTHPCAAAARPISSPRPGGERNDGGCWADGLSPRRRRLHSPRCPPEPLAHPSWTP